MTVVFHLKIWRSKVEQYFSSIESLCVNHNKLWKILQEMGIPDHLTCLLRNLYAGQEATVRTGHGTTDWFQIGNGVCQGWMLLPSSFNIYAERWGEVAQSCPTLCDPVDCNLLSFSIHGILQARILQWIAISFSRGSSWPRDRTWVSHIGGRCFNLWAMHGLICREHHVKCQAEWSISWNHDCQEKYQ